MSNNKFVDYYAVLEIDSYSTLDQVKKAYHKLALQLHPDRNPHDKEATVKFQQISAAYETLFDPIKRSAYDHQMSQILQKLQRQNHPYAIPQLRPQDYTPYFETQLVDLRRNLEFYHMQVTLHFMAAHRRLKMGQKPSASDKDNFRFTIDQLQENLATIWADLRNCHVRLITYCVQLQGNGSNSVKMRTEACKADEVFYKNTLMQLLKQRERYDSRIGAN